MQTPRTSSPSPACHGARRNCGAAVMQMINHPSRRTVVGALGMLPVLPSLLEATAAQAQSTSPGGGFSIAAYGDSRPMMFLPSKEGNPDLKQLFVEMFGLVMPEKIAEDVVKRDVKIIFDPVTHELIKIVMPF